MDILDEIGFKLEQRKDRISEGILKLKSFYDEHGKLPTPQSDKSLSLFCYSLRNRYRHKKDRTDRLSPQDLETLNEIGFRWECLERCNDSSSCLRELKQYFNEHGHFDVDQTENLRLARYVQSIRYAYNNRDCGKRTAWKISVEKISELESIGFTWERSKIRSAKRSFESRVEDLKKFKQQNGHLNISREKDQSLYGFCNNVRYGRSNPGKGMMITDERVKALDEIGFRWAGTRESEGQLKRSFKSFESRVEDLKKYKQRHGHLKISRKEDQSLFDFCNSIRYGRSNPGKGMMVTDERVKALDEIGFTWAGNGEPGGYFKSFESRVEALKKYKQQNGHLNISRKEDQSLHDFCQNVRYGRKNPGKGMMITDERVKALDEIGFTWAGNGEPGGHFKSFESRVEALKKYKQLHGHLYVTRQEDPSLFNFCNSARTGRNNPGKGMKVTDERVKALDEIGFPWGRSCVSGPETKSFEERLDELRKYKHLNGHTDVRWADDISLAAFCSKVRFARKTGRTDRLGLTDARIAALDSLGFDWF